MQKILTELREEQQNVAVEFWSRNLSPHTCPNKIKLLICSFEKKTSLHTLAVLTFRIITSETIRLVLFAIH